MITFAYNPGRDRDAIRNFFTVLPFVLPCKFCRSHLVDHYGSLPFEDALGSRESLSRWLWKIHGRVNNVLRNQGQTIEPDPSYAQTKRVYEERFAYGCSKTEFPGWEFLFSIVENHPFTRGEVSTPIPGAPPRETLDNSDEWALCRWNYLTPAMRFAKICQFWSLLPQVLPFPEWRTAWIQHGGLFCSKPSTSKQTNLQQLWKIRCAIENDLQLINRTKFHDLCNDLRLHRSGCSKSSRARTCRKTRSQRNKRKD